MAKRKKKGRAKPATESQANVAEAEVRPAEAEAQPESAVEERSEVVAEGSQVAESADGPVGEGQPETAEAVADNAEEVPAAEPTESPEDVATSGAPEVSAEEGATAEEPASGEAAEAAAEEGTTAEEPASGEAAEAAAEEGTAVEEPASGEAAEAAAEEGAGTEEPASGEATAEEGTAAADEAPGEDVWAEDRVAASEGEPATGETSEQDSAVWTEGAEGAEAAPAGEGEPAPTGEDGEETPAILDSTQMESIIEGLLFASDRVLGMADFKRLLEERDGKKITAALESLTERRKGSGIEVVHLSNGWHLRTNSEHARWVSKLLSGKPMRLSRAMMETLAIVAYRQPVTRPEIDEIRGVDCGPVLKTLLDRGLVRVIGKKEDVGRPMLYGTTPEFLRVFNLRELSELPTLREYAELNSEQQAVVNAKHGPAPEGAQASTEAAPDQTAGEAAAPAPSVDVSAGPQLKFVPRGQLPDEPEDNDPLLDELDAATKDASKILGAANEPPSEAPAEAEASAPAPAEPSRES